MQVLLCLSFIFALFAASTGEYGVKVSGPISRVSKETWQYLNKVKNITFAVVDISENALAYPDAVDTIKNARAAGISNVDAYIAPCNASETNTYRTCLRSVNAQTQVVNGVAYLKKNNVNVGRVWIELNDARFNLVSSFPRNIHFIGRVAAELKTQNYSVGIHTSEDQLKSITGGTTAFKDFPLWYYGQDDKANFNDFKPFDGWTKPAMKYFGYGDALDFGKIWRP